MGEEKKPCTLAELLTELETLKCLVMYSIGCQASIEAVLQEAGIVTHEKINTLTLGAMEHQKKLMSEALNRIKGISDLKP